MHETREEAQVFSTFMIKDKYSHGYSENIFCFLGKCLKCIASITTIPTGIVNMEFNTSVYIIFSKSFSINNGRYFSKVSEKLQIHKIIPT